MTLRRSEISKRARRLLKTHGIRPSRPNCRLQAEANGVIVLIGEDGSMHVHLEEVQNDIGPTIYAELSGGHVTTWNHLEVKKAIDMLAAIQVLDDLAAV